MNYVFQKENGMLGEEFRENLSPIRRYSNEYAFNCAQFLNEIEETLCSCYEVHEYCTQLFKYISTFCCQPFFEDLPQNGDSLHSSQNCLIYLDTWNLNTWGNIFLICVLLIKTQISQGILKCFI